MKAQSQLPHIVGALRSPGRLPGSLHSRQQETDQDADDSNYHQQLHQREARITPATQHGTLSLLEKQTTHTHLKDDPNGSRYFGCCDPLGGLALT